MARLRPLVVLVDDEPDTLAVLFELLFHEGYRVIPARDGASALENIGRETPQVVITDVRMPGMDGLELLRRLKSLDSGIRVILLTDYADQALYHAALALRADAFISKPCTPEELLRVLDQVLGPSEGHGTGEGSPGSPDPPGASGS